MLNKTYIFRILCLTTNLENVLTFLTAFSLYIYAARGVPFNGQDSWLSSVYASGFSILHTPKDNHI